MPFDADDEEIQPQKNRLKNVSSQRSIFDSIPQKTSQEAFEKKAKEVVEKQSANKFKAAELAGSFNKMMSDKTLSENKNTFQVDLEIELLKQMAQLAININNDSNEKEGMGSLSWIVLILKTLLNQRDKINKLEFLLYEIKKG